MRLLPLMSALTVGVLMMFMTACRDSDPVTMGDVDSAEAPTMLTRNVETLISDSGVTRFRIKTPVWYVYDEVREPYWFFPEGLKLEKFDPFFRTEATVTADSATYYKDRQVWQLDGHVDIRNVLNEKFQTQQLFWDQRAHKLYSDSFIHIERPDKVLEGYGFDSNEQLTRYTIRNVSGIFPAGAFKGGDEEAPATANDSIVHAPAIRPQTSQPSPATTRQVGAPLKVVAPKRALPTGPMRSAPAKSDERAR